MEPLKLAAITKKIIWGGTRLSTEYGMGEYGEKIAEAWELTDRADGVNTIVGGQYDGVLLSDYLALHKDEVAKGWNGERFPLLIKLIDAEADLSIQVHPDDEYAAAHTDDLGKTEMWYIVDAKENASIIYGLKERYTKAELRAAFENGTLEAYMNRIPVKKGEVYFIPSGLVHAICHGLLIAEIQQNSNITYRVYDYNRRDADGNLRTLHIEDALPVIEKLPDPLSRKAATDETRNIIASCEYFTVYRFQKAFSMVAEEKSFVHLLCTNGAATLMWQNGSLDIKAGESVFVPAGFGKFSVSSGAEMIVTTL